jgi:hypothetical protein
MNKPLWLLAAFLGCGGSRGTPARLPAEPGRHSELADDARYVPSYGKPELQQALIAERGAEATGERVVGELQARQGETTSLAEEDQLRVALADLAVRRRFIASLEACEADGQWCPPRLDDPAFAFDPDPDRPTAPPVEAALQFDLASWRTLAAELHGRACACRTIHCVDAIGAAIDQLEPKPLPEVQGDDAATLSITRARECLFRLRGKSVHARVPRSED